MSRKLKIAALQQDIAWGDSAENLLTTASNLNGIDRDTDLVLLPELFSTGYVTDAEMLGKLAEKNTGHTMDDVHRWAAYFGFAVAGTFLATDGHGKFYNRAFFVEPSGDEYFYDKRHLFCLSREGKTLTHGDRESPVVRYRGWNIKMFVCYDLRFPVWCRKHDNEFDIMLFPSNWPKAREFQFRQLLSARAIENNAIVVGCNRLGCDDFGEYTPESSGIFDLQGRDVSSRDSRGNLYATFDYDEFEKRRSRFPTYLDNDRFTLDI